MKESSRWTPPLPGVFKINVDGATLEDGLNSSVGAVIRDSGGVVLRLVVNSYKVSFQWRRWKLLPWKLGFCLHEI